MTTRTWRISPHLDHPPTRLDRLAGARITRDRLRIPCPAHGGTNPNLELKVTDDRISAICFSQGCSYGEIAQAIEAQFGISIGRGHNEEKTIARTGRRPPASPRGPQDLWTYALQSWLLSIPIPQVLRPSRQEVARRPQSMAPRAASPRVSALDQRRTPPQRLQRGRCRHRHGGTAEEIFAYTYAVLHDPTYRQEYAVDLLREFPRLPLYRDFHHWAQMGQKLLDLHMGFESAEPYPLERHDRKEVEPKRAILRADKSKGTITLDERTTLSGVPEKAWEYQLGSRSALEWVLDQYKERKPRDPTIRERFNSYRFSDHTEGVIDLLARGFP